VQTCVSRRGEESLAASRGEGKLTKPLLTTCIVVTGIVLGVLHHKLKPRADEKQLNEYAQNMRTTTEWQGHIAPDFQIAMTSGDRFQLSENVGKKIIVLNFFATWCEPCREEMPELNRYFNAHAAEAFVLIGIDADEKRNAVDQFLKGVKLDFPVGIDDGTIEKQYGVSAYPTTILIGVDGKVQFYETGSLANADVAFNNLLDQNRKLLEAGRVISTADYRLQAQKQPALPHEAENNSSSDTALKLDDRGKRIVARMDCPCGCEQKVQGCTCNTSNNIKKALSTEDFKNERDDEIIKSLNKRFCVRGT
jgi:thiol-disulfide isomerase/thioredoxin